MLYFFVMLPTDQKRVHANSLIGHQGESLVMARIAEMGFVPHVLNRLETGTDIMVELREPVTGAMLAKWLGIQVKTTESGRYTRENDSSFEYLVEAGDLAYWDQSNIPAIVVLVRLSDNTIYWRPADQGCRGEPRRLEIDRKRDVFDNRAADAIGALTIDKRTFGGFIPPLQSGENGHLNLVRMALPDEIFVAHSPFKSGREAVKEMLRHDGPYHFDWVIRDRAFWSFRDPRGTVLEEIVDADSVEAVETEAVTLLDDVDDQNAVIDLLRRSVEVQLSQDLFFDKESRALCFRASGPGMKREYRYMSLSRPTKADVVMLIEKDGRDAIMRHHAFTPRYQRVGDEWFVSITPTFVFTIDGYRPHQASGMMLTGKKKREKAPSIRGQFVMWRHLLITSDEPSQRSLLDEAPVIMDPRPRIRFEPLEPLTLPLTVPEQVWSDEDPEEAERIADEVLF